MADERDRALAVARKLAVQLIEHAKHYTCPICGAFRWHRDECLLMKFRAAERAAKAAARAADSPYPTASGFPDP